MRIVDAATGPNHQPMKDSGTFTGENNRQKQKKLLCKVGVAKDLQQLRTAQ